MELSLSLEDVSVFLLLGGIFNVHGIDEMVTSSILSVGCGVSWVIGVSWELGVKVVCMLRTTSGGIATSMVFLTL